MKKKMLIVLLSVFLLSAMIVPSLSQLDMTVGVSVGDHFTFESVIDAYTTTNASYVPSEFDSPFISLNQSDYVTYTVLDVVDKNITFQILTHWSNGTETTTEQEEAIDTSYNYWAIGANMEAGDVIREASFMSGERTINETTTMEWGDVTRDVNVHDTIWDWSSWFGVISHRIYYWDKETGMLLKEVIITDYDGDNGVVHLEQTVEIVDTNLWVIPEFPTGTAMLLVFIAITVSIDLYRRKTLKH
jgi:hypothetical protein